MGVGRETDAEIATLLRSVRRWLLVLVSLFGVLLVALAAVGYEVSGATDGTLYAAVGLSGGLTALVAGVRALVTLGGRSTREAADESAASE